MSDDNFFRVLKDRARICDLNQFAALLDKYGQDDACLKTISEGVRLQRRDESPGDYLDSASRNWHVVVGKEKALDDFYLERGPRNAFNQAADGKLEKLQAEVDALKTRVHELERLRRNVKFTA